MPQQMPNSRLNCFFRPQKKSRQFNKCGSLEIQKKHFFDLTQIPRFPTDPKNMENWATCFHTYFVLMVLLIFFDLHNYSRVTEIPQQYSGAFIEHIRRHQLFLEHDSENKEYCSKHVGVRWCQQIGSFWISAKLRYGNIYCSRMSP